MTPQSGPDVARRRFLGGLMAGGVAATVAAATESPAAADTADGPVSDVASYGATGDGTTDDTAAIQAAIDAAPAGGTVLFGPGTFLVRGIGERILRGRAGIALAGSGATSSVLRVGTGSAAVRLLDLAKQSDVQVRDLGFDANGNVAMLSAVCAASNDGQRSIAVQRCGFQGFMRGVAAPTFAAVYAWPADNIDVLDSEFIDCGRAITVDQPEGPVRIAGNRISSTDATLMATGIWIRRSSGASEADVVVSDNSVSGARLDPSGVGADGHGIAVFRCHDVRITGNHCEGNGRGILVSNESFGAVVQGNTCVGNNDAGIRCEPAITTKDITVGLGGARRGVTVVGNVSRDNRAIGTPNGANSGIGITMSYAAGSTVSGNIVHGNTADGIHCDSDRVSIVGNIVYANWTGYRSDPLIGKRAGIRIYAASGCTVVGNQCYDGQARKTQQYGLSLSGPGGAHVVHGNSFVGNGAGHIHGGDKVVHGFFGATPVTRRPNPGRASRDNSHKVLNNLVKSLRELGLVN